MQGCPGRVLFRLLGGYVSTWVISSAVSRRTFESGYIFPHLFCLVVCERNQCVVSVVSSDFKRLSIILIRRCERCTGFGMSFPSAQWMPAMAFFFVYKPV